MCLQFCSNSSENWENVHVKHKFNSMQVSSVLLSNINTELTFKKLRKTKNKMTMNNTIIKANSTVIKKCHYTQSLITEDLLE